jgi:hypothetical protein
VVYSATLSVLDEAVAAVMGMVGAGRATRNRSGRDGGTR